MQRSNPKVDEFYHSKAWEQTRDAYYKSKLGICERCGMTSAKMIVHHKTYININNIDDTSITLDTNNLELLCLDCHNKEHFGGDRSWKFDEQGNLIEYRKQELI